MEDREKREKRRRERRERKERKRRMRESTASVVSCFHAIVTHADRFHIGLIVFFILFFLAFGV